MTIDEVVNNIKNKYFHGAFFSKKLTSAEQIIREAEWTEDLLHLVRLGNTHVLKNFRYRVNMEYDAGEQEEQ
jgi:hypothetical protein